MNRIIAVCNQKGGVGKTTTCVNLASALGSFNKRVLVIDTDPQAHATLSFGVKVPEADTGHEHFFTRNTSRILNDTQPTKSRGVDVLPYFINVDFKSDLPNAFLNQQTVALLKHRYDYVLVDCVPYLEKRLLSILIRSDAVIVPVQCEFYALKGVRHILKTIQYVKSNYHKRLDIEGFLVTMYDGRLNYSNELVDKLHGYFGNMVFSTIIHRNTSLSEAPSTGNSILDYNAECKGARDYVMLADELIAKHNEKPVLDIEDIEYAKKSEREAEIFRKFAKNPKKDLGHLDYNILRGLTKVQVAQMLGQAFNDFNADVWMYAIKHNSAFFGKKYIYLFFSNQVVQSFKVKRFKSKTIA